MPTENQPLPAAPNPRRKAGAAVNRLSYRLLLSVLLVGLMAAAFLFFIVHNNLTVGGFVDPGAEVSLQLPQGFRANVFASGLNQPRFITFGPDGALYVADRANNRIVYLPDANGDGQADATKVFADNIPLPHSVVYHDGVWYVGVSSGVIALTDTNGDGTADQRQTLIDSYGQFGHSTRTVLFLPDGRMVVSVGSSCNVCIESDKRRAAILVYDGPNAANEKIYATGLRNAVGLALNPVTGDLWATNNGRDLLGDDTPPETVYDVKEGSDYGWPRCHAGDIIDPDFGSPTACEGVGAPVLKMQAHSAPLGLAFYTGTAFPSEYRGGLFIAFHGSWNRSVPTGYKVVWVPMQDGKAAGAVQDFATGFAQLQADDVKGRPVGLAIGPDGALYVSDDKGGFIYRIVYNP